MNEYFDDHENHGFAPSMEMACSPSVTNNASFQFGLKI